jgi:hypothetical protein
LLIRYSEVGVQSLKSPITYTYSLFGANRDKLIEFEDKVMPSSNPPGLAVVSPTLSRIVMKVEAVSAIFCPLSAIREKLTSFSPTAGSKVYLRVSSDVLATSMPSFKSLRDNVPSLTLPIPTSSKVLPFSMISKSSNGDMN